MRLKKIIKNKYFIGAIVIIIILVIYYVNRGSSSSNIEFSTAIIGNVQEKVSVTGKILAIDKADLAFEKGGVVTNISVKIGDRIQKGELVASLDNADTLASLASAQAKLDDMTRALRPEELQVEKSLVDSAQVALDNARTTALNASRDSYVQTQGALVNYIDTFFTNPQSANPTIKIAVQSSILQNTINQQRAGVSYSLGNWKNDIANASSTDGVDQLLLRSSANLSTIKSFADSLSSIVNYLNPGNSGLTQPIIDTYVSDMNMALSGLNQAITSVTNAKTALKQTQANFDEANSNFVLKNSGSSAEAIRAQKATVDSLAATVTKGQIFSPLDGLVTKVEPSIGEFVSAGQVAFSVITDGIYKIEAYVPEADIAKVAIGDKASVTLDAYGSNTFFDATVTAIDPAETVIEGVSTYKVTLLFDKKDDRIRSGMTANTDIMTHESIGVIMIPTRAIINATSSQVTSSQIINGLPIVSAQTVRILNQDGKTYKSVPVTVGLKGSDGLTEILSGVVAGQKVVTYVK